MSNLQNNPPNWDTIKADLGWILALIVAFVTGIQPFLTWLSGRRKTTAEASKTEAEAIAAGAGRDLTMAEASEKLATTATQMVEVLERRASAAETKLVAVTAKYDEINSRQLALMEELSEAHSANENGERDLKKAQTLAIEWEVKVERLSRRGRELIGVMRNLKSSFPFMMQGLCPPEVQDEMDWLLSNQPLRDKCDDGRKVGTRPLGGTRSAEVVLSDQPLRDDVRDDLKGGTQLLDGVKPPPPPPLNENEWELKE